MRGRSILALALAVATSNAFGQDPELARNLAATCTGCHGTDGRSLGGIDSLAGVPKASILEKLRDFKSGARPATIMHQISKGYTDQQLERIAEYFAAQK